MAKKAMMNDLVDIKNCYMQYDEHLGAICYGETKKLILH